MSQGTPSSRPAHLPVTSAPRPDAPILYQVEFMAVITPAGGAPVAHPVTVLVSAHTADEAATKLAARLMRGGA
jgi:hypothetical protein